jgi:hypothetical protein
MIDLLIEGDPVELQAIRSEIERSVGSEAQIEPINSIVSGELREPILIGVIVALGGPAIVRSVVKILRDRYAHVEAMERLENEREAARLHHEERLKELEIRGEQHGQKWEIQLKVIGEDGKRIISLDDLEKLA